MLDMFLVSASLGESQGITKLKIIHMWLLLMASESTNSENSLKKSEDFKQFFFVRCSQYTIATRTVTPPDVKIS